MTIKTLQFIEVDSDPMHAYPFPEEFRDEYRDLRNNAFANALNVVVDSPEEATCDNCKGIVGYYLEEADDGRLEHAYWHYTALILHGLSYPVVRLCEDCAAPVIQPPLTLVAQAISDELALDNLRKNAAYRNRWGM